MSEREDGWSFKLTLDERLQLPCGICGEGRKSHTGRVFACWGGYGTYWNPEGQPDPRLIKPIDEPPVQQAAPNEEWWDQHAVQCGNCSVEILTRKGSIPNNNGLSDTGDSEDEALCGRCAGAQMYIYMDELDAPKQAAPEPPVTPERLRDYAQTVEHIQAPIKRWADRYMEIAKALRDTADYLEQSHVK